jgi:hypothetical protein
MRRRANWLLLAMVLALVPALAGCQPADTGIIGLTMDRDGHLVVALAWCNDSPPDRLKVYTEDAIVARYENPNPDQTERSTQVRLDSPPANWTVRTGPPELEPETDYHVDAWNDSSWAWLLGIDFRLKDVTQLPSDRFLVRTDEVRNTEAINRLVSEAEFRTRADKECE